MYRQLRSEYSGRIATVTLARPERRNALSAELMREMIACAQELATRKELDVVLVTGAAGVFSAGADLKDSSRWAGGAPLLEQREIAQLGQRMSTPATRTASPRAASALTPPSPIGSVRTLLIGLRPPLLF